MAVATTTAIAATSLAATGASGYINFSQAAKQRSNALKAQEEAKKALDLAKKKFDVNPYDALSLPTQAYIQESEAMLQQGAQLTEAAKESERGVAATAGRVQAAQQEGQAKVRADQEQALFNLDMASAKEEAAIRDKLAGLDLAEAAGAQQAAADATKAAAAYQQQGAMDVVSGVNQIAQALPYAFASGNEAAFGKFESEYNDLAQSGKLPAEFMGADNKPLSASQAYAKMANLSPSQIQGIGAPVVKQDPMGKSYTSYNIDPYNIYGGEGFSRKQARGFRKSLTDPTIVGQFPLYEPGFNYQN